MPLRRRRRDESDGGRASGSRRLHDRAGLPCNRVPWPGPHVALSSSRQRAQIVGTGLIGGSIGLGLRQRGWFVTGSDIDRRRAARALELGAIDEVGTDSQALVTFVATPA